MSDAIRTEARGPNHDVMVCVCNDCGTWEYVGRALKHGRRCSTPLAQPEIDLSANTLPRLRRAASEAAQKSAAEIKRMAKIGSGLSTEEIHEAHDRGQITTDEAMNRDD